MDTFVPTQRRLSEAPPLIAVALWRASVCSAIRRTEARLLPPSVETNTQATACIRRSRGPSFSSVPLQGTTSRLTGTDRLYGSAVFAVRVLRLT